MFTTHWFGDALRRWGYRQRRPLSIWYNGNGIGHSDNDGAGVCRAGAKYFVMNGHEGWSGCFLVFGLTTLQTLLKQQALARLDA